MNAARSAHESGMMPQKICLGRQLTRQSDVKKKNGAVDYVGRYLVRIVIVAAQSVLRSRRVLPLMPTEDVSPAAEMLDRGATRGSLEQSLNVMSLL